MTSVRAGLRLFFWIPLVLVLGIRCSSYELVQVPLPEAPKPGISAPILIGGFRLTGSFNQGTDLTALRNSIELSLREKGLRVASAEESLALLDRSGLVADRELSSDELLTIAARSPGRIWLQGYLDVQRTSELAEDYWQVALGVQVIDLRSGQPIGEIRVYGHDLDHVTDRVIFECSRRLSQAVWEMMGGE